MPFKVPFAALLIASLMLSAVTSFFGTKVRSIKDTFGVGINDKRGVIAGVKQHAVGRFRADAVDGEQAFAHSGGIAVH